MTEAVRRTQPWLARVLAVPELVPALPALGVIVYWTASDGGVPATESYPGALILLGLLAVTAYAFRPALVAAPRLVLIAGGLLGLFVLWNFLSILWADDQGAAWDGANRCLLYLVTFGVFVIPPWRSGSAAVLLGAYALSVTVAGAVTLLQAAGSGTPLDFFVADRFAEPLGYHNADAAAFTLAFFPALLLASRRETPWPLRGLMLASAGVLFQLALLPQSRGWLIAAPVALLAYFALVPRLVRTLITLAPVAILAALTAPTMLDVFDAVNAGGDPAGALQDARTAMLIGAAVLLVTGTLIGLAESSFELPERVATIGSRLILGVAALGALAGVVVALAVVGNPASWASDRWHDFKSGEFEHGFSGSRLGQGLGSNRYDFWRVAYDEFKDSPIAGVGSENFAEDYVRDRDSVEEPTHPHSLPLRVLAQTGLIGGALFVGFFAAALTGVARVRTRSPVPLSRGVAGVAIVGFVYWLLHSSGDWFWAFPAITAPVFAGIGLSMRLDADRPARSWVGWSGRRIAAAVAAGVVAVVAALSLLLPWSSAIEVQRAAEDWPANPQLAFDRLDRARDLDFLSARPDLVAGTIAVRLNDVDRARAAFARALERDPRNWYATLELGAIDALRGNDRAASARLARVAELNPREELAAVVRRGLESGHPVSLAQLDALAVKRYCRRLGRVPGPDGCRPR